jgi:hypothetical protein
MNTPVEINLVSDPATPCVVPLCPYAKRSTAMYGTALGQAIETYHRDTVTKGAS